MKAVVARSLSSALLVAAGASTWGCGGADANGPERTPLAQKWITLAKNDYKSGDFEEADRAAGQAIKVAPQDNEARILAGRIALTKLDYTRAIRATEGLNTSDAHAIRGRAFWYAGDIDSAADELEALLQDPQVKDPWAVEISKLARRGTGRHPFAMEGSVVAAVELPPAGVAMVVPCELEGEQILALVSTALGEVVVDSNSRREAAWVNFRFTGSAGSIEVHDVPALTQDLSSLSKQLRAPVKALIGVNMLRHAHVTFDRRGDQFVLRKADPSPPPEASRVPLYYVRGGGMMMRVDVSKGDTGHETAMVDTTQPFAFALDEAGWKAAGVDLANLKNAPDVPNVREGLLPNLRIGSVDIPQVPAITGAPIEELKANLEVGVNAILGAGIMSLFRVTFTDDGRAVWLESDPSLSQPPPDAAAPGASGPGRSMPDDGSMPPATGATSAAPGATSAPAGATAPATSPTPKSPKKAPKAPGAAQ